MIEVLTIGGIISLCINLFLGLFVYFKNPARPINRCYAFFTIAIALWSGGSFLANSGIGPRKAVLVLRVCYIAAVFLPTFYLHFISHVVNRAYQLQSLIKKAYLISFLLSLFLPTGLFLRGVRTLQSNFLISSPGPIYYLFSFFMTLCTLYGLFLLFIKIKKTRGSQRYKLKWMFGAQLIAQIAGFEYFSSVFQVWNHIPCDDYILLGHFTIMSYAILRHQLLDIEVIVKKTLVLAGLLTISVVSVAFASALVQQLLGGFFADRQSFSLALGSLIIIAIYDPTKAILIKLTDKYLFQKALNFRQIFMDLSNRVITILDIGEVGRAVLETFESALRLESGVIVLKSEDGKSYNVLDAFGIEKKISAFPQDDPFITYFSSPDKTINLDLDDHVPDYVMRMLKDLKAVVVIPLFFQSVLIGLLALGKKKSDQEYTRQEMEYFPAISAQIAVALSNAEAIEALKKNQVAMAQQSKLAALGTLSAGIAHEIYNPVNQIGMAVGMLRMNKDFYTRMPREEYEKLVFDVLNRIEGDAKRVFNITERLSAFARQKKELKKEPVNLHEALDNVLLIMQGEFKSHQIAIERRYETSLPLISGDLHALEEVFFNLLVNARHAIRDKGSITLSSCVNGGEIVISIADTGHGIPPENLAKIFDPFFTTKDTTRNPDSDAIRGSGLGLHLVREILGHYNGRITVESEVGKGTTFHVLFPAAQDLEQLPKAS